MRMLLAVIAAVLTAVRGWNDCAFPGVDYFALDEGVGISYTYANAGMNGKLYSGGYTKGNFAFVGVTDAADVNPVPEATLWGDTTSDIQNLYVAEVSSSGSMTKGWHFKGSALQVGAIGHGTQTNSIDASSGLKAMLDKQHLVVKGGFRQLLTLPNGTTWSSATRLNPDDQVPFLMKLDVSTTQGIGPGTSGWAKTMDDTHPGGAIVHTADGDMDGDMIVSYTGYARYNATASCRDGWGRPKYGCKEGGVDYLTKLSAANGSEIWKHEVPLAFRLCRAVNDGTFFCGYTMSDSDGPVDFGNGVVAPEVVEQAAGIVKYGSDGLALWAKPTHNASFGNLGVSGDGTLLAISGSSGRGAKVSRIDTSAGNEGAVMWTDHLTDAGTHGFRGCEVTDDGSEVIVFGQHTGTVTLTDTTGSATMLRSRGSYEVFVAAYDAADGSGKWAVDGGGDDMEYFFAMSSDPVTHDVYVGGTSRSEYITWGDVKRKNAMYTGDITTPVGSSKAFTVKLKSTTELPSCLTGCSASFGKPQASDVKPGHCYIDRHCYKEGDPAPYPGDHCMKCDPSASAMAPMEWTGPDTTAHCVIEGQCIDDGAHRQTRQGRRMVDDPCLKCDVSSSTSSYTAVNGCLLDMSSFDEGSFFANGSSMPASMQPTEMQATIASQTAVVATKDTMIKTLNADKAGMQTTLASQTTSLEAKVATIATLEADKAALQATIASLKTSLAAKDATIARLEADKAALQDEDRDIPAWAIALIVVVGVLFLLVFVILCILVSREQQGRPLFVPTVKDIDVEKM